MISDRDVEFHHSSNDPYDWAETNYFGFYIPEKRIVGSIYTVARAQVGACVSDIVIHQGLSSDRYGCIHYDVSQHLPLPERFSDYHLANGLHVTSNNPPMDYRIDYVGFNGVEIHLDYKGLMLPFDIHDPSINPLAQADRDSNSGHGSAYRGHFDQSARVTGEIVLNGHRLEVDCIDTMDHSWGPRPERYQHQMGWIHAHFSENLLLHVIVHYDPAAPKDDQFKLANGYILRDGEVNAIVAAEFESDRIGQQVTSMRIRATDKSGQTLDICGAAIAGGPWICYSNQTSQNILMRWQSSCGHAGYGIAQELYPVDGAADRKRDALFPKI